MLDTKRSRGWVIVGFIGAILGVGLVLGAVVDRSLRHEVSDFTAAAETRLADTTPDEAYELWLDRLDGNWVGEGEPALDRLLAVDGRAPERVSSAGPGQLLAVYRIDVWGRDRIASVQWSDAGFDVDTD